MQPAVDLAPEVVIGGRYRLLEPLATGGTSSVWRAHDAEHDRVVALKVLRDEGVDAALRSRAAREARVLADLAHPNLVRVLDSGDDDGLPYMAMELLNGETLSRILAERGALPVREAVELVADVADGLGMAHSRGVIHRDVKPSNIMCKDQLPTLVDFGIARTVDATTLTRGLAVGTAAYLAPEQAQGLALAPTTDVYALGCVLYEALTGHPPFDGDSPVSIALKHVQEQAPPPGDTTDVPATVDAVVMRCLAKEPSLRPADGAELAAALRAALTGGDGRETVAMAPATPDTTMIMPVIEVEPADPDAGLIDPSPLPPVAPPPERRRPTVSYGVLLLLLLASLLLFGVAQQMAGERGADGGVRPVPEVVGSPVENVMTYLEGAGLEVEPQNVPSDAPAGIVVASEPAAGEPVAEGGTVTLHVSAGPPPEPDD